MNKSQRIRINLDQTTSKFITTRLDQNTKTLEILSLKINQKDIYQSFNADYGVLIGRVIANEGVGIPNAKVSIFIPIDENDENRPEIVAAYPYKKPYDKNRSGKRYNLLPRVSRINPETGTLKPKQPFGSFPTKEEVVTNETWLEVYEKYYKYTTVTNNAGDYMLFGVPVGVQTVHMSVDITDIGKYSMTPSSMVTQLGYSENLFLNNGTKIKSATDLQDLPNIETQEISVDVVPFWGDSENFEIGITRQDFRIRAQLVSNFVIFGSHFTMGETAVWGTPEFANRKNDGFYHMSNIDGFSDGYQINLDARINRIGDLDFKIFTYPSNITENTINNDIITSGSTINTTTDIIEVDSKSYYTFQEKGQFLLEIPCNRKKIITNEFGQEVEVDDDNTSGIFTEFLGMIFFEYEDLNINYGTDGKVWDGGNSPQKGRLRFKFPQGNESTGNNFGLRDYLNTTEPNYIQSEIWKKNYYKFKGNKIYGISQFFPTQVIPSGGGGESGPTNNLDSSYQFTQQIGAFRISGVTNYLINQTQSYDGQNTEIVSGGYIYDFPANINNGSEKYFGGNWLNFAMYFPQFAWTYNKVGGRNMNVANTWMHPYKDGFGGGNEGEWFVSPNQRNLEQHLIGLYFGTRFVNTRASSIQTTFVEVPRADLSVFNSISKKGLYKYDDITLSGFTLEGNYKYRIPSFSYFKDVSDAGFDNFSGATDYRYGTEYTGIDSQAFFFKGMYQNDCIKLLFDLNII